MTAPSQPTNAKPEKRDLRQEVTDRIIGMLENGVAPWQKPWEPNRASMAMPVNPTTEKTYRGGNAIHLMSTSLQKGYDDPRWMTYKQAADHGWQVRKGEKGTQIEFWEVKSAVPRRGEAQETQRGTDEPGERRSKDWDSRLIQRVYTVFNGKQIEGIPAYKPRQFATFEVTQAGEDILKHAGARITHDQADAAFYHRASDSIHLPPKEMFKDAAGYYGTALHELAHWTGHPTRLNRQTLTESYRFGDTSYAKEELRAELASVFLAAARGIPHDPAQHAAYVGSWIKFLKEDKNEIFRAAHDASAAADFLLALERDRSIADEALDSSAAWATGASSRPTVLEQETSRLERDREDLIEQPTPAEAMQESNDFTSRYEARAGAANLPQKHNGEDRRARFATVASSDRMPAVDANEPLTEQGNDPKLLTAAQAITTETLGASARTVHALTQSGTYQGPIIGETELYVIQRQSANLGIAHVKNMLDRQPGVGESVAICYSGAKGTVRSARERANVQELGR